MVAIGTTPFIGEGFDAPALDTLFLSGGSEGRDCALWSSGQPSRNSKTPKTPKTPKTWPPSATGRSARRPTEYIPAAEARARLRL